MLFLTIRFSLSHFKSTVDCVVAWWRANVFITSDQEESLFLSSVIASAPVALLLGRISTAVNNSRSLPLTLSRVQFEKPQSITCWLFDCIPAGGKCFIFLCTASCVFIQLIPHEEAVSFVKAVSIVRAGINRLRVEMPRRFDAKGRKRGQACIGCSTDWHHCVTEDDFVQN